MKKISYTTFILLLITIACACYGYNRVDELDAVKTSLQIDKEYLEIGAKAYYNHEHEIGIKMGAILSVFTILWCIAFIILSAILYFVSRNKTSISLFLKILHWVLLLISILVCFVSFSLNVLSPIYLKKEIEKLKTEIQILENKK